MEDHSHQQKLHQPESHQPEPQQPESQQPDPRQLLSQQSLPPQSTEQPVAPQPLPPQPAGQPASPKKSNDPLHGLTLEKIVTHLVESYGWEQLAENIRINCFSSNPSIQSSLKFLRKTPWARTKVEDFYKYSLRRKKLK